MDTEPETIFDKIHGKTYIKGKLLGKGGFAKCYELTDSQNKEVLAGKIIMKSSIKNKINSEKLKQEISIHKSLNHENIVKFCSFFEDPSNVYIMLELCKNRSLLELHKRRKFITEPETRYFSRQIARACVYLHAKGIIHRDLKLANIFLNENMIIKLGDFGLATRLEFEGDRKKTMCGTPNYIAPEVLTKDGHTYEVDSWSLGCIIYTMLVGRPPFESGSLKDTYSRIKNNQYSIPTNLSKPAQEVIRALLASDASHRPSMKKFLTMSFFSGFVPDFLPISCLTVAPRWDNIPQTFPQPPEKSGNIPMLPTANHGQSHQYLVDLYHQVQAVLGIAQGSKNQQKPFMIRDKPEVPMLDLMAESEDPTLAPVLWISKWVDYSDKYGLGYQLSDGSKGMAFNDLSRMIVTTNDKNLQYIEQNGTEYLHTIDNYPIDLSIKVILLKQFKDYMNKNLKTTGENMVNAQESMSRLPYLKTWFRSNSSIVLYMSNGTLQINLVNDHTKLILCPLMGSVTYIDKQNNFRTFKLQSLLEKGMTHEMNQRLLYAYHTIERLIQETKRG